MKNLREITRVTLCLVTMVASVGAQAPATKNVTNPNPELVAKLTKTLSITPEQAIGGAGAIFGLAKNRLSPADFSKVAAAVPGMDRFLKAAPVAGAGSTLSSLGSVVGGGAGGLAGALPQSA